MRLNLSSQIVLNQIPGEFYRPATAIERSEIAHFKKVPTDIFPTIEGGAIDIANHLEADVKKREQEGRRYVMSVGSGSSLTPIFQELIKRYQAGKLSFKDVVVFSAYEYFPLNKENVNRGINQLKERFLNHVDIDVENTFTPDGAIVQNNVQEHCRQHKQHIKELSGLDVILLGIGRMGNIATGEPGSSVTSASRLILIDKTSREEMKTSFGPQESVPPCSITMGVSTILSARKVFLTAWGEEKANVIKKTVEGKVSDTIPASFSQTYNDAHAVVDLSAAAKLTRIQHPWLVASCKWTDKLVRSALVWLCQITGKPLLKLTSKDYNENGFNELPALYGSAYNANIKIFSDLQHTITGWPGSKPDADDTCRPECANPFPKRVIVFSPHPDDDVISTGGTLRRLVQQGHDVHAAYETSGNIAVSDEEVVRFMHFINGFNQLFANEQDEAIKSKYKEIKEFLKNKKEGDIDSQDICIIKGLIRRDEARTASTFSQIPLDHVHFLDLPFYESGKVEKPPMDEADVNIVRELTTKVKPHQIYVAGDLADPYDTHRKCIDAVLVAIDPEKEAKSEWLKDCRVWMYHSAWAEWEIENIEMCAPISPEELYAKRNSILKHQSQMESAPLLGSDERLFWQRSEDRNRGIAKLYDDLGLACYEATEAFIEYEF